MSWQEPWRFASSLLLHGSFGHLLYNMFALALFGSLLEKFIGGRKFVLVFFISGIIANLIGINFYDSSLGASGAIYGVFGVLMVIRPGMIVWAAGFPMPMLIAGFVWAAGDLIGLFIPSNIGHIAHLSGMIAGLFYGIFVRVRYKEKRKSDNRIIIDERDVRRWEDYYMKD
ncbi:MAG: rhomboid family intramembrane serine protease [Nanoarchaeota archaeon]|nr:rhomboid family intramembrane serine protease [Nanoarchaeota archaeon]